MTSLANALEQEARRMFDALIADDEDGVIEPLNVRLERKNEAWRIRVTSNEAPMLGHEVSFVLSVLNYDELWQVEVQNGGLEIVIV